MDMGINYNTMLSKVNRTIDLLRTCKMDVTEFEKARDSINEEVKKNVKKSYDYNNPEIFAGSGQEAFLVQDYSTALSKLNRLYGTLEKYDIYIKAYSMTKVIKDFLSNSNINEEEFDQHRTILLKMLVDLNHSATLDYQVEEPIIKEIYHAVYLFIKEEYLRFGVSKTMEHLVENEYIDGEVRKEIENINLKEEKYLQISHLVNQINSSGINGTYATEKLIQLLVDTNTTEEKKKKMIKDLEINLNNYISDLTKLNEELTNEEKRDIYTNFKLGDLAKDIAWLLLNTTVTFAAIYGANAIGKLSASETQYLNTSKVYVGSDEDVTVTTEYKYNKNGSTTLYEYYPSIGWVSYDIDDYDNKKIEDYMNLDVEGSDLEAEIIKEGSEKYDLLSKYNDSVRIIEEIDVDIEDNITEVAYPAARVIVTICLAFLLGSPLLGTEIFCVYRYESDLPFILELANIRDELEYLIKDKKNKKNHEKKINELTKKMVKLIKENKETIKKVEGIISRFENDPAFSGQIFRMNQSLNTESYIIKERKLTK